MALGRPVKDRIILHTPKVCRFSPRGHAGRPGHIEIKIEEYEAIRLADFVGLEQRAAAVQMGISQQTYSRVLRSGRKSLARAMIRGDIIRIEGGHYKVKDHGLKRPIKPQKTRPREAVNIDDGSGREEGKARPDHPKDRNKPAVIQPEEQP